jgi:hypothetical protein
MTVPRSVADVLDEQHVTLEVEPALEEVLVLAPAAVGEELRQATPLLV